MLVKDEFIGYKLRLGKQLEYVNDIISTLVLTYYFKVGKKIDYYKYILYAISYAQPSVYFGVWYQIWWSKNFELTWLMKKLIDKARKQEKNPTFWQPIDK